MSEACTCGAFTVQGWQVAEVSAECGLNCSLNRGLKQFKLDWQKQVAGKVIV